MLIVKSIFVNVEVTKWRFKIKFNNSKILNDENFAKNLINKKKIYIIVIVDVELTSDKNVLIFYFSSQLNKYEKLFNKKKTNILFK